MVNVDMFLFIMDVWTSLDQTMLPAMSANKDLGGL